MTVIVAGILAHMIRGDGEDVNVTISLGRTSIGHSHRNWEGNNLSNFAFLVSFTFNFFILSYSLTFASFCFVLYVRAM